MSIGQVAVRESELTENQANHPGLTQEVLFFLLLRTISRTFTVIFPR